jgi:hypothetical protein
MAQNHLGVRSTELRGRPSPQPWSATPLVQPDGWVRGTRSCEQQITQMIDADPVTLKAAAAR